MSLNRLHWWAMRTLPVVLAVGSLAGSVFGPDDYDPASGAWNWGTLAGFVLAGLAWMTLYAAAFMVLHARAADAAQHKKEAEVPRQRDLNRSWIKHARHEGATQVRVWFAAGEYDDAEQVDVPIREALAVLAKHSSDFHLDAVGRAGEHEVTAYLSEWTEVPA